MKLVSIVTQCGGGGGERGGDERVERWEVGRCGRVANTQSVSLGDCQGVKCEVQDFTHKYFTVFA